MHEGAPRPDPEFFDSTGDNAESTYQGAKLEFFEDEIAADGIKWATNPDEGPPRLGRRGGH